MSYNTEHICCEVLDCENNLDYRCLRLTLHMDADGKCTDYEKKEK